MTKAFSLFVGAFFSSIPLSSLPELVRNRCSGTALPLFLVGQGLISPIFNQRERR